MKVFVDASAIIAVMSNEAAHAERMFDAVKANSPLHTNAIVLWECAAALFRKAQDRGEVPAMNEVIDQIGAFCSQFEIDINLDDPSDRKSAAMAFEAFGRLSGHPAQLNMGDCFHYAVAKRLNAATLFTSPDEFHHTDLDCALPPA